MSFGLNEAAQQYETIAIGGGVPHHGQLGNEAVQQWKQILEFLTSEWRKAEAKHLTQQKDWLWGISSCLDKLSAVMLQTARMRKYHDNLLRIGDSVSDVEPGMLLAHKALETLVDFESLLVQGRSSLDVLTWFISNEFKNKSSSFTGLENILKAFENKNRNAKELLGLISDSKPIFQNILVDSNGMSLRSKVTHYESISKAINNCFGITFIAFDKFIVFDCESNIYPIMRTSQDVCQSVAFLMLNSVAIFVGVQQLDLGKYLPIWKNRTVTLSDFVTQNPSAMKIGVIKRMTPGGFEISDFRVKKSVLDFSIQKPSPGK